VAEKKAFKTQPFAFIQQEERKLVLWHQEIRNLADVSTECFSLPQGDKDWSIHS